VRSDGASLLHGARALLLCASFFPIIAIGPGDAAIVRVPAGTDLQQAIERARPGQTLVLDAGATYTGNFVLPVKAGGTFITIRTAEGAGLPSSGARVLPEHAPFLAKLKSPNTQPAIATRPGAHHWRLQLLEFLPNVDGVGDIIALGDGGPAQTNHAQVPHALEVDRCLIQGDPEKGQKRGIALNSGDTVIIGSYIADIKAVGQDSQAIGGWNGPGPYRIENNYLEGAGENFLLGGADPAIQGLVTSDVVFRSNHLKKPVGWQRQRWQVKNLFELKNARRVLVEHNVMEHSWRHAQAGYAVLLTPRNQDGSAPWATVEDVTFRYNVVRHAGGGIQITGEERDRVSGSSRRITIQDNLFYGIDSNPWGGPGIFLLIGEGPSEITVERNTISQSGNIISAFGGTRTAPKPIAGFVFRENLVRHNAYGVHGADRAVGADTLKTFFPGAIFQGNVIAGGDRGRYPAGNQFVSDGEFDDRFRAAVRQRESAAIRKAIGK
jgi:hypothetical protein